MDKFSIDLDQAFSALSDPTRRAIISRLCDGPLSVSELSKPFPIAFPSLLKHVRVLEDSGLVRSEKTGRVRTCRIEPHALEATEAWLHQHVASWERRLNRLEAHIDREKDRKG